MEGVSAAYLTASKSKRGNLVLLFEGWEQKVCVLEKNMEASGGKERRCGRRGRRLFTCLRGGPRFSKRGSASLLRGLAPTTLPPRPAQAQTALPGRRLRGPEQAGGFEKPPWGLEGPQHARGRARGLEALILFSCRA
jgi:hypothetical protein